MLFSDSCLFLSNKYIIRICRKPILQQYCPFNIHTINVLPNKHHLLFLIKKPINSLFPRETINNYVVWAGLLTCFGFLSFPFFYKNQWNNSKKLFGETHSSGSVADLHGIPF